jgi:hypothetical protein
MLNKVNVSQHKGAEHHCTSASSAPMMLLQSVLAIVPSEREENPQNHPQK